MTSSGLNNTSSEIQNVIVEKRFNENELNRIVRKTVPKSSTLIKKPKFSSQVLYFMV